MMVPPISLAYLRRRIGQPLGVAEQVDMKRAEPRVAPQPDLGLEAERRDEAEAGAVRRVHAGRQAMRAADARPTFADLEQALADAEAAILGQHVDDQREIRLQPELRLGGNRKQPDQPL